MKNLEDLLLKSAQNEDYQEELESVLHFYQDDFVSESWKMGVPKQSGCGQLCSC